MQNKKHKMSVIISSIAAESTALTVRRLICPYLRAVVSVWSEDLKMLDALDSLSHLKAGVGPL